MANLKPIHLDTLKVSSISTEGPTKTATGGMAADTLLKYGKKFTIEMEDGGIMKGELYEDIAPETVANFEKLANSEFYDGLIFHRVIDGFMIQGGCPNGNGMGGPGYSIKGEFNGNGFANSLHHGPGVLSMARAMHPDSAGSQFFICDADVPHLDSGYAGFGCVIEGLELVHQIARVDTNPMDKPRQDVKMEKVTVETFGVEYPEPETV